MEVYLDIHEPKDLKAALEKLSLPVNQRHLDIGDVQIGRWVIERKTWNDLISSYLKSSFWERWGRIKDYDEDIIPVLLIEGTDIEKWQALSRTQNPFARRKGVLGTAVSLINRFNVHILHAEDKFESAYLIFTIYNIEAGKKERGHLPLRIQKSYDVRGIKENMVMCIPHIGATKAREILEKAEYNFKNVPRIIDDIKRLPSRSKELLKEVFKDCLD